MNLDALTHERFAYPEELLGSDRMARTELQSRLDAAGPEVQDALVRRIILAGVPEAQALEADARVSTGELCGRALAIRGGLEGGIARIAMREKARLHLHLAQGPPEPPCNFDDILAFWEEATRREPCIRLRISEPRWREETDDVPFIHMRREEAFGGKRPEPGTETADPKDIPRLMEQFLAFCKRSGLPPEVSAARSLLVFFRIHPFVDGNGHTGRLITCNALAQAGYPEPMLLAYVDEIRAHRDDISETIKSIALGNQDAMTYDTLQLRLLLGTCKTVQAKLAD